MKILNNEEIKAVAADIFKQHEKAERIAVTADGQAFIIDESDASAKNHANRNKSGKKLEMTVFTRAQFADENASSTNVAIEPTEPTEPKGRSGKPRAKQEPAASDEKQTATEGNGSDANDASKTDNVE